MENKSRKALHQKNESLEGLFLEMQKMLGPLQTQVSETCSQPQMPIFFIVGCARSGSTLLYQYLANSGLFAYPTNLLSRFFYAPYVGARIQQLLLDYDNKKEVFNHQPAADYNSKLGKTSGAVEPHEFWYFWERFFKFGDLQQLDKKELLKVDWITFMKELHSIEKVFNKPIVMKAMNMNWHIIDIQRKMQNVHFIYIRRNELFNAQSLLQAREAFFGERSKWYSFKPENYNELLKLLPEDQVVRQVNETNSAIERQLKLMDKESYTIIQYEEFCKNPFLSLERIVEGRIDLKIMDKLITESFVSSNKQKLDNETFDYLKRLVNEL